MTHEEALEAAERARAELATTRKDRWYPQVHAAAPAGWINDPNGLAFYNGEYHLFYQHHPYGTNWGPMHWGHLTSPDLVHWTHRPMALAPTEGDDAGGAWSGSGVVAPDGRLLLFYTGNRWRNGVDDAEGKVQTQLVAASTDGLTFEKIGRAVDGPALEDVRDPKVWRQGDTWCMVVGASVEGRGRVLLYTSTDLASWEYGGVVYEDPDPEVFMIECPDLFELDGHWVIAYGPMSTRRKSGFSGRNGHNAGYVVGDWTPGEPFEVLKPYAQNDWGHNFYAGQSMLAPDGRRIVVGWMGGFTLPLAPQAEDGWSGQMAVPRELRLTESLELVSTPIREFESLRASTEEFGPLALGADEQVLLVEDVDAAEIEMVVDLDQSDAEQIALLVHRTSSSEFTKVAIDTLLERVVLDRGILRPTDRGLRAAPAPMTGLLALRLVIDRGSVEVFIGEGENALSSASFPGEGARSIALTTVGGSASITELRLHRLESAW